MISLLAVFISIFGYSQPECDICGWPYTTGVNSDGKCYLLYQGMQQGLQSGCYTYCDAWARSSGASMPATPMLSFVDDASGVRCVCQRLTLSYDVEYKTRPTATCDFGYSDQVQNYYDSVAVNWRSAQADTVRRSLKQTSTSDVVAQSSALAAQGYTYMGCGAAAPIGDAYLNPDAIWFYQVTTNTSTFIPFPPGKTCVDFHSGSFGNVASGVSSVLEQMASNDTALFAIKNGIDNLQKQASANQSSIMEALDKILNKPTGGGGGGDGGSTDLTGVYAAIDRAGAATITAVGVVGDSVGSLRGAIDGIAARVMHLDSSLSSRLDSIAGGFGGLGDGLRTLNTTAQGIDGNVTGVRDSLGRTNQALGAMTDSVGRFYQHVQRVDSLNNARWTAEHDADSAAYAEIQDSLSARSAQGVQARQKLSELEAASSNAEGSSDNFLSSLSGFQSLPGTCSEAPIYDVDLTTLHMGRMEINLNGYPWVLSLSRGLFRFLGAVSAVTMIMGSLKIFSMTKKEA